MNTENNAHPLVTARGVEKRLLHEGREVSILRGIDLTIEAGEMVAVMGASGAGKSTLLHILGTLDQPSAGQIFYRDRDITLASADELADLRNKTLGFVFQFHHLLPEFSALENVMMPGSIAGLPRQKLKQEASDLLNLVGLSSRASHRPSEMSGGEQQRVALARALIMKPAMVLADEPTGNLDSATSRAIRELFFEINRARGTAFLVVTHSMELANSMPRVVTMRDGLIETDERKTVPMDGSHQSMAEELSQVSASPPDDQNDGPEAALV